MSHSDSIRRVVEIMHRLNEGQAVSVERMARLYDVHVRTIRRDFELIKDIFGAFVTKEGDAYRAYDKLLLERVLSSTELMQLSNVVSLLSLTEQHQAITDTTQALIKRSNEVYAFKSKPFEQLPNLDVLKKLEHTITYRQTIQIQYQTRRGPIEYTVQPYKIVFLNENFYLVGVYQDRSGEGFKFFRVALIRSVSVVGKTFLHDQTVDTFIEKLQTPWALFDLPEQTIRLRVDKRVKKYFIAKQYLPSQQIVSEYPNGDIQITYQVTRFQEIEELIIKWLPGVRVLEPQSLKTYLKKVLLHKMRDLGSINNEATNKPQRKDKI